MSITLPIIRDRSPRRLHPTVSAN